MADGLAKPDNLKLTAWYDKFLQATQTMREKALQSREFYDGKQFTAAERKELADRSQAANVYNEVKPKIDFLVGLEKQQRSDPRGYPRNPFHEEDAEAVTDSLRFIVDRENYDQVRSSVWFDIITAGWGGHQETLSFNPSTQEIDVGLEHNSYDRMWWDIHANKPDFSDAKYLGLVRWMNMADAIHEYGEEARDALNATKTHGNLTIGADLHEDRPRGHIWYDRKEDRVSICQVYYREEGEWYYAEFTGGADGVLRHQVSPFRGAEGRTRHPFKWGYAFKDTEGDLYGIIEEMKDRQREINKRSSKLLHFLSTNQSYSKTGAVKDIRKFQDEIAKPDGHIEINSGFEWGRDAGLIDTSQDIIGNFQVLETAKESIRSIGASSALRGQTGEERSGRQIQLKQQGNMVEIGALMDRLRQLDRQTYRDLWTSVRQFWTAPKWVRVTDNPENTRWVLLNATQEALMGAGGGLAPSGNITPTRPVAQMDVDVIVETAPDSITLQGEQFDSLINLASAGVVFPPVVYLEAMPNLRNKRQLIETLTGTGPSPQEQMDAAKAESDLAMNAAKVENTQADTQLKTMQAAKTFAEAQVPPERAIQ